MPSSNLLSIINASEWDRRPESLGGCSVRMLLVVEDPLLVCERAVAAGAKQLLPVNDEHGWRLGRIVDPAGHHWEVGRPLASVEQ